MRHVEATGLDRFSHLLNELDVNKGNLKLTSLRFLSIQTQRQLC